MLSSYRIMWIFVMFDLPVVQKDERKAASDFRNTLLDNGFEMAQFSVYMRFCSSNTQVDALAKRVESFLPEGGKVSVLQFTDKQYERIISFKGKSKLPKNKSPDQYDLF
ncbi:CRISPR-associated endonuclease Cas2 [Polynucleobacter sp. IMCC 29146]|uniref:CRISPR-associated endonuclease Cas2 n=1 Tax=Polynucleobacter sp. IMCC 29146 TaxID=2780953 RepID=UPI0021052175|nr:CRISPR-associated endonuclease Cas2 [Polynucleobacter sp. IMCC 29146]